MVLWYSSVKPQCGTKYFIWTKPLFSKHKARDTKVKIRQTAASEFLKTYRACIFMLFHYILSMQICSTDTSKFPRRATPNIWARNSTLKTCLEIIFTYEFHIYIVPILYEIHKREISLRTVTFLCRWFHTEFVMFYGVFKMFCFPSKNVNSWYMSLYILIHCNIKLPQ